MEKMNDIAHKIKKVREIKGFSQEYMAMELNISQSQYQRMEASDSDLRWSRILQICQVLGITTAQLLGFNDQYVIENCTNSGVGSNFTVNNIPDYLIAQYEQQIQHLKEEVQFLRGLVAK